MEAAASKGPFGNDPFEPLFESPRWTLEDNINTNFSWQREYVLMRKLRQGQYFGNELRPSPFQLFISEKLIFYPKGKLPSGDAAEAAASEESASLRGKLVHGWFQTMEAAGQMKTEVLEELAEKYKLYNFNTKLEGIRTSEKVEQAGNMSPELVKTVALKELNEAYYYGGAITPELRRALGLQETAELCQIKRAIWGLKGYGLEETVESYQIIRQLKARILREVTKGCYTEQTITQLIEEIEEYHAFYFEPISMWMFQRQPNPWVVIMDPFERYFSNPPALIKQMHPKLATTAFANSGLDGYPQSSTLANGVLFDPNCSRQTLENEFVKIKIGNDKNLDQSEIKDSAYGVPKKHIVNAANAVVEALKVPNVMLEGNKIFVSAFSQVAVGVMTNGSVNSSVLTFFSIAAVTGFLGCLWAMYLQKNQVLAKWLSKIGAVGSTCAITVALSMNFANEKNSTAFFTVVTLACILSGALIMRSK